jgi:drug/metabolite transporter (DMT)-like permease
MAAAKQAEAVAVMATFRSLGAAWVRLPENLRGALWITMGTIAFALNDAVIKHLGRTIHPFELAFFRYAIGFLLLLPVFVRMGWSGLKTTHPGLHGLRLIVACTAQVGVIYSVIHLMLADATAIAFSRPLFTTLIAVFVLGEAVGRGRWTATAIGFAGVLVMVRPGHAAFDPVALVAVCAACAFAFANVMIRLMARTEPPNRILFYYHAGGTMIFALPAAWMWTMPVGLEWLLLFMIGALTTVGMVGFVRGFSAGEASIVGPMEYTRLIYAGFIGYYLFAEVPDIWTGVGALIIVVSTLYIARREAMAQKP